MRGLRSHLTYANVMSTIAVFGVLGGGAAYAAGTIGSSDIIDGQVMRVDLADESVTSAKIAQKAIRSVDVGELSQFTEAVGASPAAFCTDDDQLGGTCASANITLQRAGKLLLNATGEWHTARLDDTSGPGSGSDNTTWVFGTCQLFVDGTAVGNAQDVGERAEPPAPPSHPFGGTMALTGLSTSLSTGLHHVIVQCNETDGDLDWGEVNLTAALVAD